MKRKTVVHGYNGKASRGGYGQVLPDKKGMNCGNCGGGADHAAEGSRGVLGEMGNRQQQPIGPAWGPQRGLAVDEITRVTGGSGIKERSRADGVAAEDEEDDKKDSEFGKRCAGEAELKPRGTRPHPQHRGRGYMPTERGQKRQ